MELVVSDLDVARGGAVILRGIGFRLGAGQGLILRGPNGIGKTTLLRTLAGLQPAVSGTMLMPPESLTYAGHADGAKSTLTVAENLNFWAAVHGASDIVPAMDAMNLTDLADRRAAYLSAGQRRRLGLARLLVTGRAIWALDEPTVSLDAASVRLFAVAVRGHLAAGGAVLIASHIDLGFDAEVLDLSAFQTTGLQAVRHNGFDEAFL
jgi:heme exporter protein A